MIHVIYTYYTGTYIFNFFIRILTICHDLKATALIYLTGWVRLVVLELSPAILLDGDLSLGDKGDVTVAEWLKSGHVCVAEFMKLHGVQCILGEVSFFAIWSMLFNQALSGQNFFVITSG